MQREPALGIVGFAAEQFPTKRMMFPESKYDGDVGTRIGELIPSRKRIGQMPERD